LINGRSCIFSTRSSTTSRRAAEYEKWYALYEAVDTFFYRPGSVTKTTAHVRDGIDLKRMMITVWLCTFPAMFFGMWNTGYQANLRSTPPRPICWPARKVAFRPDRHARPVSTPAASGTTSFRAPRISCRSIGDTFIVGGFWEVLFASIRKHEVNEGFFVTSVLFTLTLPPTIPLWQVALGISSAW
jgi:Na+-transporting NADH:ubiquinone oxidoreductase subunit B